MKILLVQPNSVFQENMSGFEPLALEYIAAGIIDNHDVKIFDMYAQDGLMEEVETFEPHIVGFSSYTNNINLVLQNCVKIKEKNSNIKIVLGGQHVTAAPRSVLLDCVDFIVINEGVFTFKELVTFIELQKTDFSSIDGLIYRDENNKFIFNKKISHPGLDELPLPARFLTKNFRDKYQGWFHGKLENLASLVTSRGCPFRCTYCNMWKYMDGKYLIRNIDSIVEELKTIEEDFIFFADDESMINTNFIKNLCDNILKAGIKKNYKMYGRCDTIAKNPDIIKSLKEIGLEGVIIGFESHSDEKLQYLNKKNTIDDQMKSIEVLEQNNVELQASLIIYPSFIDRDFDDMKKYVDKMNLKQRATVSVLTPLPATDLFESTKHEITTDNYDLFDVSHAVLPTALPLKDFYERYADLVKHIWSDVSGDQIEEGLAAIRNSYLHHETGSKALAVIG